MIVIVPLDDKGGMLFHHRRQSQDRLLRADLLDLVGDTPLWMNAYSKKQFQEDAPSIRTDEAFLDKAGTGEFCFCEDVRLLPYQHKIEKIILYKWNRVYPADLHLDLSLEGWVCAETKEFAGSSHDKITREVYVK